MNVIHSDIFLFNPLDEILRKTDPRFFRLIRVIRVPFKLIFLCDLSVLFLCDLCG